MSAAFEIATAVLFSIGTGGALVLALSSWLGKVWANRILEKEKLKYSEMLANFAQRLDFQLHSSKAVFDAEFQVYRELWDAANKLKHTALNIRPWHGQSEMTAEQIATNYKYLQQELIAFDLFVNNHKPFFAPAIFDALSHLQNMASIENKKAAASSSLEGIEYARSRVDSIIPIIEASEEVCKLIRERLFSNIVPNQLKGSASE
ncbi:MAG: hypothetical protein WBL28_09105 [Methylotenera sp.]